MFKSFHGGSFFIWPFFIYTYAQRNDTNSAYAGFVSFGSLRYDAGMSLVEEILRELSRTQLKYKGIPVNLFGVPRLGRYSKRSLRSSADRLAKNDLIRKELNGFILTAKGREYLRKKADSLRIFHKPATMSSVKDLLVMFDVPVAQKAEREWFRFHLKKFGYSMIQKSVWVGPSPLPKDFLEYMKEIKLKECIKTFKLAKPYT
ncbi:MAG: CRISPR-associated endonuclease Cas2 [bacterium]